MFIILCNIISFYLVDFGRTFKMSTDDESGFETLLELDHPRSLHSRTQAVVLKTH